MSKELVTLESRTRCPTYTMDFGKKILVKPMGLTRVSRECAEKLDNGSGNFVIMEDSIRKAQKDLDKREADKEEGKKEAKPEEKKVAKAKPK